MSASMKVRDPVSRSREVRGYKQHEQWNELDVAAVLGLPTLLLVIGQSKSILTNTGAQSHERLWERARQENGTLPNTLKLVAATRKAGHRVAWTSYEVFRQSYTQTMVDKAQYDYWARDKAGWSDADKARDAELIDEVKAIQRPEDLTLF